MVANDEIKQIILALLKSSAGSARQKRLAVWNLLRDGPSSPRGREALQLVTPESFRAAEEEMLRTAEAGVELVVPTEERFPDLLRHIPDSPALLYVRGQLSPSDANALRIAVVGTRKAAGDSRLFTQGLCQELASQGVVIVSGLALGIDASAHYGALQACAAAAAGIYPGTAILGCGVMSIYPSRNESLAEDILRRGGALVSEYGLYDKPYKHYFPERNRIISGMCHGTVVVEARQRSGSLITSRLALEQGRDVFAVPGRPLQGSSAGTNQLIKQGASLIECADDILSCYSWFKPTEAAREAVFADRGLGSPEARVLSVLKGRDSSSLDFLQEQLEMTTSELLQLLTSLELRGLVHRLPGGLVSLHGFVDM